MRAVQFGTGAFLRGFVDFFLDEARRRGSFPGRVVVVGSTGSERVDLLEAQDGLYTLVSRGLVHDERVQARRVIGSVGRALSANEAWDEVLAYARAPELSLVFSNTTEVGIALDPGDQRDRRPPRSFPAKLTAFLYERGTAFAWAPERGVVVLPCELVENNGERLRALVLELANRWQLDPAFAGWIRGSVRFCNTQVDRIVPGTPPDRDALETELGFRDRLLTECEPYRLFVIEGDETLRTRLGFSGLEGVVVEPDITPYRVRKIRVLNGSHTVMVPLALLCGLETVAQAVEDPSVGAFVRRAMLEEIVPGLDVPDGPAYALTVLDRFANPFLRHRLVDITLESTTKMGVRVIPSVLSYAERTGSPPPLLSFGFAAWLLWMRGDGVRKEDSRGAPVRARCREADLDNSGHLARLVDDICADVSLWDFDLRLVPGFADAVAAHLTRMGRDRVAHALGALLAETPPPTP